VESAETIRQRNAEVALNQADPELAAWLRMYRQLSGPDGEKYFLETLKPSPLPKLRGTVIRCDPAGNPDGSPSYLHFRHRVFPLFGEPEVAMIVYVGIEPDGYVHS